ncbi:MAG: formate/nitrite transporter family protein [Eubacteriales bacterium]|nr:formate/nitrite transporter family protein [Eubacteriales bacterium]
MNSPAEIAKNYVTIGVNKMKLPISKMLILGIFAGMYIAFGAVGSQVVAVSIAAPSVAKWVGSCVFPVGLMLVLVAGAELFTGNCLLVIPVLEKKASISEMLKSWFFVYIGNFIGSILVALAVVYSHALTLFDGQLAKNVVAASAAKSTMNFSDALIKGILCNMLVCLAVWVSFAAKELAGKIIGLMLPIMLFVLCGYEHSVANMYFGPAGIFASSAYGIAQDGIGWGGFLLHNLLPVTLGNIIGGSLIVGAGYWFCYLRDAKK